MSLSSNKHDIAGNVSTPPSYYSPAQDLPIELLSEIFLICLQNYYPGYDSLRPDRPPWTFGKVCRHWRSVCLSTSLLWVQLPRLNTNSPSAQNDNFRGLLRTSLALSNPALYRLHLTTYLPPNKNILPQLMDDLFPHMGRCEELTIAMNAFIIPKLCELPWKLDALKTLNIRFHGRGKDFESVNGPTLFKKAPSIDNATVELVHPPIALYDDYNLYQFDWLQLPWGQLTSFSAINMSNHSALEVLRHAPTLHECSFTAMWTVTTSGPEFANMLKDPLRHVVHGKLRSISLHRPRGTPHTESYIFPTFLRHITAPGLTKLHLTIRELQNDYMPQIAALIQRSVCSLTSLTLYAEHANNHFAELLLFTPCLQYLEMCFLGTDDLAKIRLQGAEPLVPHLRHLTLVAPSVKADDIDFFITSRTDSTLFGQPNQSFVGSTSTWNSSPQPLESFTLRFGRKRSSGIDDSTSRDVYYELEGWNGMPQKDQAFQHVLTWKRGLETLKREQEVVAERHEKQMFAEVLFPSRDLRRESLCLTHRHTMQFLRKLDEILADVEKGQPTPARYLNVRASSRHRSVLLIWIHDF